jgi:hypothetical protein
MVTYCEYKLVPNPSLKFFFGGGGGKRVYCTWAKMLRAGIFKKSMGARHRVGIGLLYRPARLHSLAEFIPWNRFRGPIHVQKYQLWAAIQTRGSILAWIVILSVYGADTIAEVKLLISPFLR